MMFEIGVVRQEAAALTMAAAAVIALLIGALRARKAGIAPRRVVLCTLLLPLAMCFCARLLYGLITLPVTLPEDRAQALFAFWRSGYSVYGGILGMLLVLLPLGGQKRLQLTDAYAPALMLLIAAFRVSEGFCGQGYGEYWYEEEIFFCRFPFMMFDADYECWAWALFMAEALLALVLFVVLMLKRRRSDGMLWGLGLYAAVQLLLESLRRDEYLRWGFVRSEEVLSAACVLAVLIAYALLTKAKSDRRKAVAFCIFVVLTVFCTLLEFATEKRIPFLRFLEVDGCYLCMAAACVLLCADVLWMRTLCPVSQIGEES